MKGLERAAGFALFSRTANGLVLTKEGAALLQDADSALSALAGFNQRVAALQTSAREILRLGTILDPEFTRIGSFLKELVEVAPKMEIQLNQGTSDDVLAQIGRKELDAGFWLDVPGWPMPPVSAGQGARRARDAFLSKPLRRFFYRVAAPPGWEHRVHGKGWKRLGGLPWLATPQASAHRRLLAAVFDPLGIKPQRVAQSDQESTMLDLVESGVGLSLVRDSIAAREAETRKLVIADKVSIECALSFVCLKSRLEERSISRAWQAMDRVWA